MIDREDRYWYRDAVIYQVHVKSFFDSDNDGVGDFEGLTRSLDYIRELGANSIWLMPFYPSPLRDDGYDIADYRGINPSYGSMRDFRRFVREAHARGLRVITELVINHTSDQHPWFQRAREAKPGSAARNFYVWSDSDQVYKDVRIIFLDTETSNWTWDPVAKSYYWHRFYSHQPDLNFDNPRVLDAVLDTMRFWLDLGVDGLRLDAIPYLVERDGTNCENLPETHEILRKIRATVDAEYPDRMLLAEANQWPEETAEYFGKGDECHMAFHFPLMPRMFMSLAQEDRHPVTDIMRQTSEIPEGAQWAIFLRNHDELTLEMVTGKERDYLWAFYAREGRARINLGIRRRLAPLLENDRRKIELLNSFLFSMPGTPVIYYGDEIGMGDNIYLGDRDGVRTPMQWSPDRNGGFSRADPARLFLPALQDAIYGYAAVNVEAQLASPSSLLNWTRRMIAIRRRHRALGRGSLRFLYPANRKVLAYLRELDGETLLCIANVSRAPQAVELDLAEFRGAIPIELTGGSAFPPVGGLPYLLTLPAYGFYWFKLDVAAVQESRFGPVPIPELFTLVLTGPVSKLLTGRERTAFERQVAPRMLPVRRWFSGKAAGVSQVKLASATLLPATDAQQSFLLTRIEVELRDGKRQDYFVPVGIDERHEEESIAAYQIARVRRGAVVGAMFDADAKGDFAIAMIDAMRSNLELQTAEGGKILFKGSAALDAIASAPASDVHRAGGEQSNTSLAMGETAVLKLYRRLQPGLNPEIEIGRFLTEVGGFASAPAALGSCEYVGPDGAVLGLALLQTYVRNQGDAWTWGLEALKRGLEKLDLSDDGREAMQEAFDGYLPYVEALGRRTGELHVALASPTEDEAFAVEPLTKADVEVMTGDARHMLTRSIDGLKRAQQKADKSRAGMFRDFLARVDEIEAEIARLDVSPEGAMKTRVHGDYHLGQVLIVQDDVVIVDFEGEPSRGLEERRAKFSPLRDVAGMLRSFSYAAETAARDVSNRLALDGDKMSLRANAWRHMATDVFLEAYGDAVHGTSVEIVDVGTRDRLLRLHLLAKALYEIDYEANHRPDWIDIPIEGVREILDSRRESA